MERFVFVLLCFKICIEFLFFPAEYENKPVALKLTEKEYDSEIRREYKAYAQLNAINNTSVELYSIPIFYHHQLVLDNTYECAALSLFEESITNRAERLSGRRISDVDFFLVALDMVGSNNLVKLINFNIVFIRLQSDTCTEIFAHQKCASQRHQTR